MSQEQVFTHRGFEMHYTVGPDREIADVRFAGPDGKKLQVRLDPQEGGGAYVAGVPLDAIDAITELGFHIWPRPIAAGASSAKPRRGG